MSKKEKPAEPAAEQPAAEQPTAEPAKRASKVRETDVPIIAEHLAAFDRAAYFVALSVWLIARDRWSWAEARSARLEIALEIADALVEIGKLPRLGEATPLTLPLLARIVAYASSGHMDGYAAVLQRWDASVPPRPTKAAKGKAQPCIDPQDLF